MSTYTAEIHWQRAGQDFPGNRYSRKHVWKFDGGIEVPASASPHVVPGSPTDAVDPEEAFVASLSSCHMLWFLFIAARQGYIVDDYSDAAEGVMGKNAKGKVMVAKVTLRPKVSFSGPKNPDAETLHALHHKAHEECYIANSILTAVVCEPVL